MIKRKANEKKKRRKMDTEKDKIKEDNNGKKGQIGLNKTTKRKKEN